MSNDLTTQSPPDARRTAPPEPPPMLQVPEPQLAELRRRADTYRFLFRTIVTVTSIIVVGFIIVVALTTFTNF